MRTSRRGQAAYEFAIASFVFALVVALLVQCAPVLVKGLDLLDTARCDAGVAALQGTQGSRTAGGAASSARIASDALNGLGPEVWAGPVRTLPGEARFGEWQSTGPRSTSLVYGGAKDSFKVPGWFNGDGAVEEADIRLSEEVFFPALGQTGGMR